MKRFIACLVAYLIVFVAVPPEVRAFSRTPSFEIDPAAEVQHATIRETATGKALEVTYYIGKKGHTAVISYMDSSGAAATVFIDREGRVTSDLGVSFSSNVTSAVWKGEAVARSGVATFK